MGGFALWWLFNLSLDSCSYTAFGKASSYMVGVASGIG